MSEVARITDLMDRTFHGPAWHGPAVMEVLKDVSAQQAAARPQDNAHSIWELTLHLAAWKDVARWRIEKCEKTPTDEENFPSLTNTGEQAWKAAIAKLTAAHRELAAAVAALGAERLDEEIPAGGKLSHYVRLHGVIQHDLYHAGQIALLKKHAGLDANLRIIE